MNNNQTQTCKKAAAQKSFSVLIVYLISLLLMTGCGGGNTPVSTLAPAEEPVFIKPVTATVEASLPSGTTLKPEDLKISSGVTDQKQMSSDGTVQMNVNSLSTSLITASDKSGKPVLLSISVTPTKAPKSPLTQPPPLNR